MLFSTTIFLFAFLPCVLFGYYVLFRNNRKWQNIFLTFCSLFFYAWGEPWFVLVMLGSIICNWAFALWADKRKDKQKLIIILTLLLNLGIMFIFKYLTFVLENINNVVGGITVPIIELPIGISFFTFQALSYVLDICRGKGKAQKNPLNVALYISFFPQLIAGPIVRYETVAEQIQNRKETIHDFNEGTCRFIIGLSKKVILANNLAIVADAAFSSGERSVAFAWLGLIAYTFQIFLDFSGYSDMAIGLGKMFGFHFLENFNYPYIAKSISDFWRRWHISLGTAYNELILGNVNKNAAHDETILFIGDSFRMSMIPYLMDSFANTTIIHRNDYNYQMIEKNKPSVIVLEFVERYSNRLAYFELFT